MVNKLLLTICFIFLLCISFINAELIVGDTNTNNKIVQLITDVPINETTASQIFNMSDIWVTDQGFMDNVPDISHADLSDLAWSVAGHTIDSYVDFNGNDLLDVDQAHFDGPVNITQNGNTKLLIQTETKTSYSLLELANPKGYDVSLLMHGGSYGGSRYGFLMSNLTLFETDTEDDSGVFVIGNYYHNPLSFVTDAIPRLNITADGDAFFSENISIDGYYSGQPLDGSIGSGILNSSSIRLHCGCINVSDEGGLNVKYPDLKVKIWNFVTNTYCDIPSNTVAVPDDAHTVYYVDSACSVQTSTWANYFAQDINPPNHVRIFDVFTNNGDIGIVKGGSVIGVTMTKSKFNQVNCRGGHLSVCDGMDITKGTFPEINMSDGHFRYIDTVHTSQQRDSNPDGLHVTCYSDGSHTIETEIDIDKCDNGASCDACPTDKYRRYIIYSIGWGDHTKIHQLVPLDDDTYNTLSQCINIEKYPLSYTLPTTEEGVAIPLAFYCGKRDDTAWENGLVDLRLGKQGFGATPDLSEFVTYTEATANVNLGNYNLSAGNLNSSSATIHGDLNVTGTSYLGDLTFNGNVDFTDANISAHNLTLSGDAYIKDDLIVGDDITMQGHLLTLGDDTANDIVIDFKGNSFDGSITWDESANTFDFNNALITTTQKVTAGYLDVGYVSADLIPVTDYTTAGLDIGSALLRWDDIICQNVRPQNVFAGNVVRAAGLEAGSGTPGVPSIRFTLDSDTGFWRPSSNTIAVSLGGARYLELDNRDLDHYRYSDSTAGRLNAFRSRGTYGSPTNVVAGDDLHIWAGWGFYNGYQFSSMIKLSTDVDGTWGTGSYPGQIEFWTVEDGHGYTASALRGDITSTGAWRMGNLTSSDLVIVSGDGELSINQDDKKLSFGGDKNANLTYDGTNFNVNLSGSSIYQIFNSSGLGTLRVGSILYSSPENSDYSALDNLVNPIELTKSSTELNPSGKTELGFHQSFPEEIQRTIQVKDNDNCWEEYSHTRWCREIIENGTITDILCQNKDPKDDSYIKTDYYKTECGTKDELTIDGADWDMFNYKAVWELNEENKAQDIIIAELLARIEALEGAGVGL